MMSISVEYKKPELKEMILDYCLIDDCISGERQVKEKNIKYLPVPGDSDIMSERYENYLKRAVFYNVAARTLEGMIGQVFLRDPKINLPSLLKPLIDDCNGYGVSIDQLSKKALKEVLTKGRGGLFIDYPKSSNPTSLKELETGNIKPIVEFFKPEHIINWRTQQVGAKQMLVLVVLLQDYDYQINEFENKRTCRHIVLRLDEIGYSSQIYEQGEVYEQVYPTDSTGLKFKEIPFVFIGSENNDVFFDKPPFIDICNLNIAHYRNSADYEEACYITGQPTVWFGGLTERWVKDVLKGAVSLGSRGGVLLPEGGSAGLLQVSPNSMPKEAMEAKERQMVALGAKLVEQVSVQRTATEATLESTAETCVLGNVANNVSWAFQRAFEFAGQFVGISTGIEFELNTDFDLTIMSAQDRAQTISEWQGGAITWEEMRAALAKAGIATEDAEKAKQEIEDSQIGALSFDNSQSIPVGNNQ